MSKAQRIDDHSFWAGGKGKNSVFPDGPHKTKPESSAEGAGAEMDYEDRTTDIRSQQEMTSRGAKKHPLKPGHRY